jgi:hypothetical protein
MFRYDGNATSNYAFFENVLYHLSHAIKSVHCLSTFNDTLENSNAM